jgi:hypothetical protein
LDYEQQTVFNLTVIAADAYGDGNLTRATVIINIINVDDNPPVFTLTEFDGSIREYATTLNSPLQVQVSKFSTDEISLLLRASKCLDEAGFI